MQGRPQWITPAELDAHLSRFELRVPGDTSALVRFAAWVDRYARSPQDPLTELEPAQALSLWLRLWGHIQTLMLELGAASDPSARAIARHLWPRVQALSARPRPVIGGMNPPAGASASLNASRPVIGGMNPPAGASASLNASGPAVIARRSSGADL